VSQSVSTTPEERYLKLIDNVDYYLTAHSPCPVDWFCL
jgi:hypothetical protein